MNDATEARRTPGTALLTEALTAYCEQHGLTPASADEMLYEGGLTPEQNRALTAFCLLWEEVQELEDRGRRDEADHRAMAGLHIFA